jgi:hypothetical protein
MFSDGRISLVEEFAFQGRWVDLAGVSTATGELVAVEVKVHDWRRVISQARHCQVFADRAFVAMWYKRAANADWSFLRDSGLGLIVVNECSAQVAVDAAPSPVLSQAARRAALQAMSRLAVMD